MRNSERWQPTKFVRAPNGLRASRSGQHVNPSSRHVVDLIGQRYERAIHTFAAGRLLDLGCGDVPLFDVYRHLVTNNICVDWNNTLHPNQFVDLSADLNKRLPFGDETFDTILLTDVLEHIAEPAQLISEVSRLLRSSGRLILGVPFLYWLHEQPHDYFRYTEYALRRLCQIGGLTVLQLDPYGDLLDVLIDLTSKGAVELPGVVGTSLRLFHAALSIFAAIPISRRFSESTKRAFPLGYILVAEK